MKTVSLDVHSDASQICSFTEEGEVMWETKVPTDPAVLRSIIEGIPGPKRVVFEEGPLSALISDALQGVAEEVISCDPTHNALISRAENANDEHDARWLGTLSRLKAVRPVFVPPEPFRSLRSLLVHDERLVKTTTGVKNRIKALCRRHRVATRGKSVYGRDRRPEVVGQMGSAAMRWQMRSLYRQLDTVRHERLGARKALARTAREVPVIALLQTAPGVGPIVASTVVAWLVDPKRFGARSKLNAYAGLGLGQGFTNWKPVGKAKASRRGQRRLKRVLLLGAKAAVRGNNALARRYRRRREQGWEHSKAIRDVARQLLFILCAIWITGDPYDDNRVSVPGEAPAR